MAHNVLSYGSPEAARRANRAINKVAQDGGFVGVKPTERRVHTAVASNNNVTTSDTSYDGMFKIVVIDNKLQVVYHGSSAITSGVGTLHINGVTFVIPFGEPVEITYTTYVYLDVASRRIILLMEHETPPPYSVLIGKYDYLTKEVTQVLRTHTGYTFDGYSGSFTICIQDGQVCIHSFLGTKGAYNGGKAGVFRLNDVNIEVPTFIGQVPTISTYYFIHYSLNIATTDISTKLNVTQIQLLQDKILELKASLDRISDQLKEQVRTYNDCYSALQTILSAIDAAYLGYYKKSAYNADFYNGLILELEKRKTQLDTELPDYEEQLAAINKEIEANKSKRDSEETKFKEELSLSLSDLNVKLSKAYEEISVARDVVRNLYANYDSVSSELSECYIDLYGTIPDNPNCSIVASPTMLNSMNGSTYLLIGAIYINDQGMILSQDRKGDFSTYRIEDTCEL